MRRDILDKVADYGTGRDTLRCLAVATVDSPASPNDMDLSDSSKFAQYEVKYSIVVNHTTHASKIQSSSFIKGMFVYFILVDNPMQTFLLFSFPTYPIRIRASLLKFQCYQ